MQVGLTRKNIISGAPGVSSECPVALAIRRVAGNLRVYVDTDGISVGAASYHVPKKVRRFINAFDTFGNSRILSWIFCRPFTFHLVEKIK